MWALVNRTGFAAERTWLRDARGDHLWLVALAGTFELAEDGQLRRADAQEPPLRLPRTLPDSEALRWDADLHGPKSTTDVIVNASAYAPGGKATSLVEVCLRVGSIEKTLLVHGEREYRRGLHGLTVSPARPFLHHPITYDWAYGGSDLDSSDPRRRSIDLRNPLGKGFCAMSSRFDHRPAHRIEYPRGDPSVTGPAGFGAIASHWSPRLELAGTFDAAWERTRRPLLPADHDIRTYLCAPADQRPVGHLTGGEMVSLINMSRQGRLTFALPRVAFAFVTQFGARRLPHEGRLATVCVEPDQGRLRMVWQTWLRVAPQDTDYLDATVITERRS